jgi:glycosyltransferase involved in cell wall biosynthesis
MKIALVVTDNFSAWNFRRGLLSSLLETGAEVAIITPSGAWDQHLRGLGVRHIPIQIDRFINPAKDLKFAWSLYRILKRERFSIVHNFSIKPNILGAFAARWAGAGAVLGSVTGAGAMFSGDAPRLLQLVRPIIITAYRAAFRRTDRVWFQNLDDLDLFVRSRIVAPDQTVLIRSSGVDTNQFRGDRCDAAKLGNIRARIGAGPDTVVVTMVSRALWNKGVSEFIQASRVLGNGSGIDVKFVLAGDGEAGNPATVPAAYLRERESSSFAWLGWTSDVRELLGASDIVTLLTWDREGVPRSLLEAMAMARPIVATDVPGCREVIDAGRNGYLVNPKNAAGVIEALRPLIADPGLRRRFGSESRRKVVREFDLDYVNRRLLAELYRFPARREPPATALEQHTHV